MFCVLMGETHRIKTTSEMPLVNMFQHYRSGTVNSNTVNSKFHLIRSHCEIFFYHFPNISCYKCTVNSNFHLIRSKTLLTNDFELTVPDLYCNVDLNLIQITSVYLTEAIHSSILYLKCWHIYLMQHCKEVFAPVFWNNWPTIESPCSNLEKKFSMTESCDCAVVTKMSPRQIHSSFCMWVLWSWEIFWSVHETKILYRIP